jgi:preprotein translocase subunit SecD
MDGDVLTMQIDLPDRETDQIKKLAADQALETIRNRIDQFGVSEPDIRRQGEKRILVQLPGIKDTKRAKALIGKTALLEFKLVDETHDLNNALKGNVPPGSEVLYGVKEDPATQRILKTPYLLKKRTLLTGANLTDARVQIDSQYNEPYVSIDFDKKGGRDFERITGENVKKRLAIVLDKKVYSAPVIQEKISGGKARITGSFTTEEARDLAIALRAGALPAPVNILEERTVGPSLGTDSIRKGLISMCVGGILVILFMIVYYRGAGLIADFALILNILLIAGGLAGFQATLTLPGIAGIILTIGMAVDANVLIFERIREELRIGKTPRAAVDAGYDKATLTILDANVTTLIAALVLFQFGTGPVKGFAVTLSLGVIASLFTALILTRMVFDYYLMKRKTKRLSI